MLIFAIAFKVSDRILSGRCNLHECVQNCGYFATIYIDVLGIILSCDFLAESLVK